MEHAYYLTPFDINSNHYHNIPLHTDSFKAATYVHAVFTGGNANDNARDFLYAFQFNLHRAHNFGNFQAYYGGGFSLGSYLVGNYTTYDHYYYPRDTSFNIPYSQQFFGSYGLNAGMNWVIPFANGRGEWRTIGFQASVENEFGDYLKFRKNLPDSVVNINAKYSLTTTLGGASEIIWKTRHGTSIGYKIAGGGSLVPSKKYFGNENSYRPYYTSQTLHVTKGRWTGFGQINNGLYSVSFQFGINYRLSKRK